MEDKIKNEIDIFKKLLSGWKQDLKNARTRDNNTWSEGFYEGHIQSYEFFIDRLGHLYTDCLLEGVNHEGND